MTDEKKRAPRHVKPDAQKKRKKPDGNLTILLRFLLKLAIIAAASWALLTFVLGVFVCHSNDMFPAVRDGDLVITWRLQKAEKDSIAAYRYQGKRYFGRIVATAGDVVDIGGENGYTINGMTPNETIYYETRLPEESQVLYPYTVQEGEIFVLSDLRSNMRDSREFGPIPLKDTDGCLALLMRRRSW